MSAPVGRCVASWERGRVRIVPPGILSGFGPIFGAPKSGRGGAGESLWRFIAPLALTAARSADCHGGLQHFEIDADHAETNMLWRYFL